jgi:hypothetical protein
VRREDHVVEVPQRAGWRQRFFLEHVEARARELAREIQPGRKAVERAGLDSSLDQDWGFDSLSRAAVRFLNVSLDYLGWIPRDPQLLAAVAHSRLVVEEVADAPSAQAFGAVASRLIESAEVGGRMKGNLQFFFRRALERIQGAR